MIFFINECLLCSPTLYTQTRVCKSFLGEEIENEKSLGSPIWDDACVFPGSSVLFLLHTSLLPDPWVYVSCLDAFVRIQACNFSLEIMVLRRWKPPVALHCTRLHSGRHSPGTDFTQHQHGHTQYAVTALTVTRMIVSLTHKNYVNLKEHTNYKYLHFPEGLMPFKYRVNI